MPVIQRPTVSRWGTDASSLYLRAREVYGEEIDPGFCPEVYRDPPDGGPEKLWLVVQQLRARKGKNWKGEPLAPNTIAAAAESGEPISDGGGGFHTPRSEAEDKPSRTHDWRDPVWVAEQRFVVVGGRVPTREELERLERAA